MRVRSGYLCSIQLDLGSGVPIVCGGRDAAGGSSWRCAVPLGGVRKDHTVTPDSRNGR